MNLMSSRQTLHSASQPQPKRSFLRAFSRLHLAGCRLQVGRQTGSGEEAGCGVIDEVKKMGVKKINKLVQIGIFFDPKIFLPKSFCACLQSGCLVFSARGSCLREGLLYSCARPANRKHCEK